MGQFIRAGRNGLGAKIVFKPERKNVWREDVGNREFSKNATVIRNVVIENSEGIETNYISCKLG